MAIVDTEVTPVAQLLLQCLQDQVDMLDDKPKNVGLRPGAQIDLLLSRYRDECCEGLAWVRVGNDWPSSNSFPQQDQARAQFNCDVGQYAVEFELGIARCAPTTDVNTIPSNDAWTALSEQLLQDRAALQRAVCCLREAYEGQVVQGVGQPIGVEGRCVGRILNITVSIPACNCIDEASPGESPS